MTFNIFFLFDIFCLCPIWHFCRFDECIFENLPFHALAFDIWSFTIRLFTIRFFEVLSFEMYSRLRSSCSTFGHATSICLMSCCSASSILRPVAECLVIRRPDDWRSVGELETGCFVDSLVGKWCLVNTLIGNSVHWWFTCGKYVGCRNDSPVGNRVPWWFAGRK
jgi:hypothetical protein